MSDSAKKTDVLGTIGGMCALVAIVFAVLFVGQQTWIYRHDIIDWVLSCNPFVAGFCISMAGFVICVIIALRQE